MSKALESALLAVARMKGGSLTDDVWRSWLNTTQMQDEDAIDLDFPKNDRLQKISPDA